MTGGSQISEKFYELHTDCTHLLFIDVLQIGLGIGHGYEWQSSTKPPLAFGSILSIIRVYRLLLMVFILLTFIACYSYYCLTLFFGSALPGSAELSGLWQRCRIAQTQVRV